MSELILWKDKEMTKLRRDMDRLFNRFCYGFGVPFFPDDFSGAPAFNLSETEDDLILEAKLPGMKPKDMDISVTEDTLSIKGEIREESVKEGARYQTVERRSGSFSRTIPLPCKVKIDDINATYKDGMLKITMPKWESDATRGVQIKVT
jgi:HSP20 family protein